MDLVLEITIAVVVVVVSITAGLCCIIRCFFDAIDDVMRSWEDSDKR